WAERLVGHEGGAAWRPRPESNRGSRICSVIGAESFQLARPIMLHPWCVCHAPLSNRASLCHCLPNACPLAVKIGYATACPMIGRPHVPPERISEGGAPDHRDLRCPQARPSRH